MDIVLLQLIEHYKYWILFPLACFEGPLISIVVGFLVSLGVFAPLPAFIILVFGDIVPDVAYYFVGRFGKRKAIIERFGHRVGLTPKRFGVIERLWEKHPGKTMWTSKLAYGLSTPFLISSGLSTMPLSRFLFYAIPVTLSQYAILMTVGYFFGNSYSLISKVFSGIEVLIAAALIIAAALYFFVRSMRARLRREEAAEEQEEKKI